LPYALLWAGVLSFIFLADAGMIAQGFRRPLLQGFIALVRHGLVNTDIAPYKI
jgi:hypothetical protein